MARVVDLRSDTLTKPTAAMRRAMAEAEVGDDVYKEDPTVNALEERMAKMLGKEAAIFVTSGTMGNLSAVMAHCWTRGQEVIMGDQSHLFVYEQGGVAQIGGCSVCALPTLEDGSFDTALLLEKIRPQSMHEPSTGLICLENTHNRCGGRVLPVPFIQEVCSIARAHGIPVHMDGARLINASIHCGLPIKDIVKDCASVSMCFSKGVGAPVGSIVAGSKDFIDRVLRVRKVLGGAMRQAGVLAAAAMVALDSAYDRMERDHRNAKNFAQKLLDWKSRLVTTDPRTIESNMVLLSFPSPELTSEDFVKRMEEVKESDPVKVVVKVSQWYRNRVRIVLHSDIEDKDLEDMYAKLRSLYCS